MIKPESVETIMERVTLDSDSLDDEVGLVQQMEDATKRTNACISAMKLGRDEESALLAQISTLLKSEILEQKWLAILALRY